MQTPRRPPVGSQQRLRNCPSPCWKRHTHHSVRLPGPQTAIACRGSLINTVAGPDGRLRPTSAALTSSHQLYMRSHAACLACAVGAACCAQSLSAALGGGPSTKHLGSSGSSAPSQAAVRRCALDYCGAPAASAAHRVAQLGVKRRQRCGAAKACGACVPVSCRDLRAAVTLPMRTPPAPCNSRCPRCPWWPYWAHLSTATPVPSQPRAPGHRPAQAKHHPLPPQACRPTHPG